MEAGTPSSTGIRRNLGCKVCGAIPKYLGKRFFEPLFGREYDRLQADTVSPLLDGLDLVLVGGLVTRGYTYHDIDVLGAHGDCACLHERLRTNGVRNPVHYCGSYTKHSHIQCAWNGVKLVLTGKGY